MATLVETMLRFVLLLALAAGGLRALDAVPRVITGLPRGVVRMGSMEELLRTHAQALPTLRYLPRHLQWPPREVLWFPSGSASATVWHRTQSNPWLIVASTTPGDARRRIPVLPAATILQDTAMVLEDRPIRVQRVQDNAGVLWHQTTWEAEGRFQAARYRGPLDQLLRITASLDSRSRQ